ncbi:hypothetical protein AO498_04207 [Algoriphagus sanaruensis]|uniref:Uncharacterized protein n=1 Tax=Algoriphagus sanaruensis TaxID=1727163 RepID=A0A142EKE1_9BACT|nr:hypothetical protein [Algoriphagus sanaruensis]AMQ55596.1 hypothetical protein AO498_04207 [Algoriphagus sanaruensis]
MLEYVKTILQKVSFSKYLFERELKKGLRYLIPAELEEFRIWCYETFGRIHQPILNRYFIPV